MNYVTFAVALLTTVPALAQSPYWPAANVDVFVESHHSSTAAEGIGRGYGAAARGEAKLTQARGEATVNIQVARKMAIQNDVSAVQAHYANRAEYDRWHKNKYANAKPTIAQQQLERKLAATRLTAAQLGADGTIAWPELLQGDQYRQQRLRIEKLCRQRSSVSGGQMARVSKEIREEVARMLTTLKTNTDLYSVNDYMTARKFIDSLRYEVQFATPTVIAGK